MKDGATRIGVFGGTFDPPHVGHLIIAEQARQQLHLDRVLFVPAFLPPHKTKGAAATPSQRIAMLAMALSGSQGLKVESLEIDRQGTSYTVDTLKELKRRIGRARLFLIVGGDSFEQFKKWKSADEIRKLATLVVYEREKVTVGKRKRGSRSVVVLRGALLNISSTEIRQRIRNGESIRFLLPRRVEQYIRRHKLYVP